MNQKNLDFLKEGLKYLGFGEGLNSRLTEEIEKGSAEFKLKTENQYGPDKADYTLHFSKSDKSDMYFFNKYDALLNVDGVNKAQTFYINKNAGVTAKESYNLLSGRAVNKDLVNKDKQPYNAWMQIDFNQKDDKGNHKFKMIHQGYGFDLDKELSKHPIKELNEPVTKDRLMKSLERGNLHQVTFAKGDKEEKMFIEANPQFKTLNLYDDRMKKIFVESNSRYHVPENDPMKKQEVSQKESEEPGKKQEKKRKSNDESDDGSAKKVKKSKVIRVG